MAKKRKYKMSGYSEGGANLEKRTLKNWLPRHYSAVADIDYNLEILRDRAADLYSNSPIGAACIRTMSAGVVNEGLSVFPRLNSDALNLTKQQARDWQKQVRREFELWSESIDCDFYKRNTFKELQRIAFINQLVDGDCVALFRRRRSESNPYSLKLQLVEGGRISNPWQGVVYSGGVEQLLPNGNRIVNGVETDRQGVLKAIWIANKVPRELMTLKGNLEWQRVKVFGDRAGMQNLCLLSNDTRIEQYRGEPLLAPVIEILRNIARYTDAELTSAIIKTYLSFFFKQLNTTNQYGLNEVLPGYKEEKKSRRTIDTESIAKFRAGPGTATLLPPGLDVTSINPQGAASTFESFTIQLLKQVGAALNLPYEVLMKNFQSSYSASKAALLQAENEFRQRRKAFIIDFCQPVYEIFLAEAIAIGRIDAPGYFENAMARKLWNNADWHNETSHALDAQKEIQASAAKLNLGLSTYTREAAEINGSDFEENIRQLETEREMLKGVIE